MKTEPHLDGLGLPIPPPESWRAYASVISALIREIHKLFGRPDLKLDQKTDYIIYLAFRYLPLDEFNLKLVQAANATLQQNSDPETFWKAFRLAMLTPEVLTAYKKIDPSYTGHPVAATPMQKPRGPEHTSNILPRTYVSPENYWGEKQKRPPKPIAKTKPSLLRPEAETILQFITNRAPSINYLQGFIFISRHTKNRLSAKGRKVYPYGQDYLARNLNIDPRTVRRIFSWLQRHHIIFKRSKENPDLHKSATWFVCTTWKQSVYFLDPQGRRPKKGSPRSPRK